MKCTFHVLVEFVKIDICQNWADYSTLRSSRIRVVVLPVFDVPCFEKLSDKAKKPFICNTLSHNADKYIVVYVIEEAFYVSLNKPLCTCKSPLNACQSGVAALMRPETMRGAFKVPS